MLQQQAAAAEVRKFLDKIYNASGRGADIDSLSDEEVVELAGNLRGGVPFATPVFDGAKEEEIRAMLDLAYPDDVAKRLNLTPPRPRLCCMTAVPARLSNAR